MRTDGVDIPSFLTIVRCGVVAAGPLSRSKFKETLAGQVSKFRIKGRVVTLFEAIGLAARRLHRALHDHLDKAGKASSSAISNCSCQEVGSSLLSGAWTYPTETRLRGWACRTRTQKCRGKLSL
jgi:hypothetical protein